MTDSTMKKNSVSGEELRAFIERVERIREDKKALADDEKVVIAELKAAGFNTAIVRHCLKVRAQKPSDFHEAQALADMYLSALGMLPEPPLFRAVSAMSVDVMVREQVVDALKKFVPANGSIVVEAGGTPLRLQRDLDGTVSVEEVIAKPAREQQEPGAAKKQKQKPDVPDVDPEEAEQLGRDAAKADLPIIKNPFPFGDARRARWDLGWRKQSGSDGMGPDD